MSRQNKENPDKMPRVGPDDAAHPQGDPAAAAAARPGARDRAARQAANRAAREARRAAARAERAARRQDASRDAPPASAEPVGPPGNRPADPAPPARSAPAFATGPEPIPLPAPSHSVRFNILIVAQRGRLARQAALLAASLRDSAPGWQGRLIVAEPRPEGAWAGSDTLIEPPARALLADLGAEITPFTARVFGRAYPYGNKIEALSLLPAAEPFLFLDSDTLITGPLDRVPFDFARPSASMRRSASWPEPPLYGPGYGAIWKSLHDRFGLDFAASLDLSQPDEHWERYLYFNAGWFFGPDPQPFAQRFLDWAQAVRDDPGDALACQSLDPWLDQVVLPLVIHALGGGRPGPGLGGLDGDMTCHYRNFALLYAREPEPAIDLAERLLAGPALAALFAEDESARTLILEGEGRRRLFPMRAQTRTMPERTLRHLLRQQGLWPG